MVTKMSDGRAVKRTAVFFLMIGMLFCVSASMGVSARSAPKLSQKKITIYMGKTGGFHVKNTKKKVQFSSSDKSVVAIKRRSKTRVILAPKRPGRAVITAKVSGRKLKCSVTVKYKKYKDIYVRIGSKDFAVRLYDNKSARMFYKRLPITIDMSDLNGNEKYYYLRGSLPSSDIRVKRIKTGDFMLYDSDCLVLFYKNFTTTYSYTPLGKIKDIRGYAAALKGGSMKVRFRAKKEQTAALSASDTTTKASPIPKETQTPDAGPTSVPEQTQTPENEICDRKIKIDVGGHILSATLENNSSAEAFYQLLKKGAVTIDMHDYGGFEKVGALGTSIVDCDTRITTAPGDIILYQGNQITIYYDVNTWTFTKLGHVDDITQNELKSILGEGTVSVSFMIF